jgi:hypothetical protein
MGRPAQVRLKFLKNIDQGRGTVYRRIHRKTEPVGLPGAMIRILAKDHDPNLVEGTQVKRPKDQAGGRIDRTRPIFRLHKLGEFQKDF